MLKPIAPGSAGPTPYRPVATRQVSNRKPTSQAPFPRLTPLIHARADLRLARRPRQQVLTGKADGAGLSTSADGSSDAGELPALGDFPLDVLREIASHDVAFQLCMANRALIAELGPMAEHQELDSHAADLAEAPMTIPQELRMSAFMRVLGVPFAADGSGGTGAFGLPPSPLRTRIFDNLDKAATQLGFSPWCSGGGTLAELAGVAPTSATLRPIYEALAKRARSLQDFDVLLGRGQDDTGRGAIGIPELDPHDQITALVTLAGRARDQWFEARELQVDCIARSGAFSARAPVGTMTGDVETIEMVLDQMRFGSWMLKAEGCQNVHAACLDELRTHVQSLATMGAHLSRLPAADGERARAIDAHLSAWESIAPMADELVDRDHCLGAPPGHEEPNALAGWSRELAAEGADLERIAAILHAFGVASKLQQDPA